MRLVKIEHSRCNEYDGTEYVLAPDHWNEKYLHETIHGVVRDMIEDAKRVKNPPFGAPGWHPPFDDHPDKTVAEVKALHETAKHTYSEWKKGNEHLSRSFKDRLVERGFTRLESDEADSIKVKTYWAHNHGLELNYEHFDDA